MARDVERRFGAEFRAELARVRTQVAEFAPDLTIVFGGDHRRAFRQVVPAFAIAMSASILPEGGHPAEDIDVAGDVALELTEFLLADGFDIAACRAVALDHAFAQPLRDVGGGTTANAVIPIPINCATAPLPAAARVLALGEAVGRFLDGLDARVLVIGTGGLSHSPPSLELDAFDISDEERARVIREGAATARTKIRPAWDRRFLQAIEDWDVDTLVTMTDNARAGGGVGANELRTWLAAGAAGGRALRAVSYQPVEEWITGMGLAVSVAG
ncbi:2,3-dihydroxyphenylpropionate 1,2-dioxygenase [Gordonia humi]|uniref:2,3-dihydroxyphenylpropionate 1,2-dioxygenase n=2 Tax=Gordonia humi TaxID=686429 RepID=A0A840EY05_9ACTN|nr:2,3-dihydroxyphenylpropionate 1,2-dioxygenase [Gordonia humi]